MNHQTTFADPVTAQETEAAVTARALLDERQEPGTLLPGDFSDLFTRVGDLHRALDAQDIDRPLNEAGVRYIDGRAALAFRRPDGAWDSPMSCTSNGLSQLGYRVLGGGGLKYLERKRQRGVQGCKVAELCWADDLLHQSNPSLIRTVQLPGHEFRTVRGVMSGGGRGYQVFDAPDLLEVVGSIPEFASFPVIESRVTLDYTRIRFLLDPADAALFDPATGRVRNPTNEHQMGLDIVVPMGEIGTGEIGNASTWLSGGLYKIRCLNGMGSWDDSSSWRWTHGGHNPAERVSAGLTSALTSLRLVANGVVEDYRSSVAVAVDDAWAALDLWGVQTGTITQRQARQAHEAQDDETSTSGRNLARVIDGITLAAQGESDPLQQRTMERFAHRLMQRGLRNGHQNGGRIVLEVAEA